MNVLPHPPPPGPGTGTYRRSNLTWKFVPTLGDLTLPCTIALYSKDFFYDLFWCRGSKPPGWLGDLKTESSPTIGNLTWGMVKSHMLARPPPPTGEGGWGNTLIGAALSSGFLQRSGVFKMSSLPVPKYIHSEVVFICSGQSKLNVRTLTQCSN